MNKPTGQVAAGYKAAYTRKINALVEKTTRGDLTKSSAAGYKAAAKRKLDKQLAG